METITTTKLSRLLRKTKGATILGLSWSGNDPARFKTDRGRITKASRYSGMVNARYDRKKARANGVEVNEVSIAPTTWLDTDGTCIATHNGGKTGDSPKKGMEYVTFYPASGKTKYTLDGKPCSHTEVESMIKGGGKKSEGKKDIGFRRITLSNITGAVINGTEYEVIPS